MSELRNCPICGREHEVADDGTIATWIVHWTGDESVKVTIMLGILNLLWALLQTGNVGSRKESMSTQERSDDRRIAVKCAACGNVSEHTIFKRYLWKYRQNEDGIYMRISEKRKTCSMCDPTNPDAYYGDESEERLRFLRECRAAKRDSSHPGDDP